MGNIIFIYYPTIYFKYNFPDINYQCSDLQAFDFFECNNSKHKKKLIHINDIVYNSSE